MKKLRFLLSASALLAESYGLCAPVKDGELIDMWIRIPGNHANVGVVDKLNEEKINLSTLPSQVLNLYDVQYNKKFNYQVVALEKIINSYPKGKDSDLVLLHFTNGMQIPMPNNSQKWGNLNPQVALQMKPTGGKAFLAEFPSISKKSDRYRDPRPIAFQGNKLVVHELWHPLIPEPKKAGFSPWQHVTSLIGIEFVNEEAYYAQFRVSKSPGVNIGMNLFQQRCQYCHGIQGVGARLGWDYLEPIPIFKLKDINHVYNLVKYRYHDELERGLMMPEQADVTEEQTSQMWDWLKALAPEGIKKYQP